MNALSILPKIYYTIRKIMSSKRIYLGPFLYIIWPPDRKHITRIVSTTQSDLIWDAAIRVSEVLALLEKIEDAFEHKKNIHFVSDHFECAIVFDFTSTFGSFYIPNAKSAAKTIDRVIFNQEMIRASRNKILNNINIEVSQ